MGLQVPENWVEMNKQTQTHCTDHQMVGTGGDGGRGEGRMGKGVRLWQWREVSLWVVSTLECVQISDYRAVHLQLRQCCHPVLPQFTRGRKKEKIGWDLDFFILPGLCFHISPKGYHLKR